MNARSATINPVLNGFIVQIGCQTVVFDSPAALGAAVIEYYLDPEKTEVKYFKNRVNETGGQGIATPVPQPPPTNYPGEDVRNTINQRTPRDEFAGTALGASPAMANDARR